MGLTAYKVSGKLLGVMSRMLGIRIRVTGTENLVCRPTLFVPNHFTRVETFLVPFVIYRYAGRHVRSLGTHSVFKGLFGRYFEAVGGMSTRHPRRNRTIVRELMTCRNDWVIYPEGGLIKNKKTVHRGRYQLDHPERSGPPHTGAAMLALKAEIGKRRYVDACAEDELRRVEFYEAAYGLRGPQDICTQGIVMVPVTLTFYPMRPSRNIVNRIARFFVRDIDPRIDEELTVEGSILLKGSEICIHFGEPIEVDEYLGTLVAMARRVAGMFNEDRGAELFLRKQARRLTDACMHGVYTNIEVSFDHLFSYGLRAFDGERIQIDDLRAALYLTARELAGTDNVRLHPTLRDGITSLVTGESCQPWETVVELAKREKVIRVDDAAQFVIDRQRLDEKHDFHTIRLHNMMQVLANEVEPVRAAVESVRRNVNLPTTQLRKRTAAALRDHEVEVFQRDYTEAFDPDASKDIGLGEPFLLQTRNAKVGVVLSHGYLASPEQVRPLAQYLFKQGHSVYAVRLPGHGTAPDQMTDVRWQDWLESLSRGMALLRHQCDHVVAGGFSLGGTLALLLASRQANAVAGVFSINAPGRLRDRRARLVGPLVRFNWGMRRLGLSGHYSISNAATESPEINYGVDYLRGIRELRRAMKACYRGLGDVRAPALLLQGDHDPLVDPDGGRILLQRLGSEDKLLSTMPFDRHLVIRDEGSEDVFAAVDRFLKRVTAAPRPASQEARISA